MLPEEGRAEKSGDVGGAVLVDGYHDGRETQQFVHALQTVPGKFEERYVDGGGEDPIGDDQLGERRQIRRVKSVEARFARESIVQ